MSNSNQNPLPFEINYLTSPDDASKFYLTDKQGSIALRRAVSYYNSELLAYLINQNYNPFKYYLFTNSCGTIIESTLIHSLLRDLINNNINDKEAIKKGVICFQILWNTGQFPSLWLPELYQLALSKHKNKSGFVSLIHSLL